MKKFTLILLLAMFSVSLFSQDIIVTKNSKRIDAIVIEVGTETVQFRLFNDTEGTVYTLLKSEIVSIVYENGYVEALQANETEYEDDYETFPSTNSDITISEAAFYDMKTREVDSYLREHEAGELYVKFHKGMKLSNASIGMFVAGGALIATSITLAATIQMGSLFFPFDLVIVGTLLVAGGIPMAVVGGVFKRVAKGDFVEQYIRPQKQHHTSLNFGLTTNGIGFVMTF
jgi:hypothetical protein